MSENLTFAQAVDLLLDGKRITRDEWSDKRWWCILKDNILQIHKAGESDETLRPWIINNGDISGDDWRAL